MEDPATAKGLVDRDIIRIVTPGTAMDRLHAGGGAEQLHLRRLYAIPSAAAAAFCDLSTGEFSVTSYDGADRMDHLTNELGRFSPREAVLSDGCVAGGQPAGACSLTGSAAAVSTAGEGRFRPDVSRSLLKNQFTHGLDSLPDGERRPGAGGGRSAQLSVGDAEDRPFPHQHHHVATPATGIWSWISPPGGRWS